jgi:hypothetical protein
MQFTHTTPNEKSRPKAAFEFKPDDLGSRGHQCWFLTSDDTRRSVAAPNTGKRLIFCRAAVSSKSLAKHPLP